VCPHRSPCMRVPTGHHVCVSYRSPRTCVLIGHNVRVLIIHHMCAHWSPCICAHWSPCMCVPIHSLSANRKSISTEAARRIWRAHGWQKRVTSDGWPEDEGLLWSMNKKEKDRYLHKLTCADLSSYNKPYLPEVCQRYKFTPSWIWSYFFQRCSYFHGNNLMPLVTINRGM